MKLNSIFQGDAAEVLRSFPDCSVDCCVTSPPYFGLRDYGVSGQIGLEDEPEDYIRRLMEVFMEVYRVLKPAGTLWLNLGDSYNGSGKCAGGDLSNCLQSSNKEAQKTKPTWVKGLKKKDLIGIPWLVAFDLRSKGWYLRQESSGTNPTPCPKASVTAAPKAMNRCSSLQNSPGIFSTIDPSWSRRNTTGVRTRWQKAVPNTPAPIPDSARKGLPDRTSDGRINCADTPQRKAGLDRRRSITATAYRPFRHGTKGTFG
jgi:hypothetical protein